MPSLREAMVRYPRLGTDIKLPDNWQAMIETAFDTDGYAAYVVPQSTQIDPVVNPHHEPSLEWPDGGRYGFATDS